MNFKKPSDIGIFDGFTEWYHFIIMGFSIIIAVALIFLVIRLFDFKVPGSIPTAIFFFGIALTLVTLPLFMLQHLAKEDARNENISKLFNMPEDQKYTYLEQNQNKDDVFNDVKTTIKDSEAQKIYEVTFGFKESGEPYIYETGEVTSEFINELKK